MDSSAIVRDKTLPIDFNESSNPDLLTEVTYGEVGISPMMEKSSTGRMSPVRGRTMKEYDQQIAELKKENFNLKLRIYFMEERMNTKFNEEDVIKHNIELKVDMENYKKDLLDKQALLEKASETIDTLTSKYSEELEKEVINIKKECDDKVQQAGQRMFDLEIELSAAEDKIHLLEEEYDTSLKPSLEIKDKQIQELTASSEERDREIADLEDKMKGLQKEVTELKGRAEQREDQFVIEMESLRTNLGRKERDIQDEVEDTVRSLQQLQKNCDKQQTDLDKKSQMIGKLEDLLRTKEKEKQALQKAYAERTTVYTRSKGIISNLAKDTHEKEQKIKILENELQLLRAEVEKLRDELQQANLQKQKDADKIHELEENLEKLVRTLGKREGELENFRDLLERAQNSLSMSETAVESLQKQLEKERCRCKSKVPDKRTDEDDVSRLRRELDDLHAELREREKQYKSKCDELDTVAQRLNINVTAHTEGSDQSDMLQKIMSELQHVKGAVQADRHVHIDINSTHVSGKPDGSPTHSTYSAGSPSGSPTQSATVPAISINSQMHELDASKPGHKPAVLGKNGSRIPVPWGSAVSPSTDEVDALQHQIADLKAQAHDLKNTLKATEETVHCQTQKMKHYRNMLIENGLLPMSRSNSVPNLSKDCLSPRPKASSRRRLSVESASVRCRSVSPTPVAQKQQVVMGYPDDVEKIVKENSKLKQQIDGYRRVLKVFQSRSPSPSEEADANGQDGEPSSISSESATCLLSSWLDMLEKFLTELGQSDQEGHAQLPTSSMEVTRLRRGLVQARGAIHSLSEASLVGQEKLSEGRLSPDSGCSDNPASALNTLKSPSDSSSDERSSTSPISDVSSSGSDLGTGPTDQFTDRRDNGSPSRLASGCDHTSEESMRHYSNSLGDRNQSPPGFDSRGRDAGANPRLSSNNSFHSMERLRQCSGVTNPQDFSVFSHLDTDASVFSTGSGPQMTSVRGKNINFTVPDLTIGDGAINVPKPPPYKTSYLDKFEQTFSPSFLGEEGDITFGDITTNIGRPSLMKFDDRSLLDITSPDNPHNKTNTAEMRERIKSLEDIIKTYEDQIQQKSRPDMDSLQQQLIELRNLRIQLEKSMARNEILERQLADLFRFSETTIHELKNQLAENNVNIKEKVKIIAEKEKIISETNVSLAKYRDNSERDLADLAFCRDQVDSLDTELGNSKNTCDQLTSVCQQLKTAVEQYKKRCEQLEEDNKKHMEAVYRYQNKTKDLEDELTSRLQIDSHVDLLNTRIKELESDSQQWRENDDKYKNLLSQTRLQVTELSADLDIARDEVRKSDSELNAVKEELEGLRDVVEEQNQHLGDKATVIERLKKDLGEKNNCLHEQDSVCHDLTSKLEGMSSVNSKLSTQLEQQRLTCADYKRQIEKQNLLTKDLKEKIDKLREELTQSIHNRETQDKLLMERQKELQETTKLKEKYLYNLKVTYKEFSKTKKELKEVQKKCEDTSVLNNTLQTELSVRERLMEDKGDMLTDDDKHNMIAELLKELKLARVQMAKILEQNENIKQKMMELIRQKKEQQQSEVLGQQSSEMKRENLEDRSLTEEIPDISIGGNQTWPLYGDSLGAFPRTDNLSCSLPLRESTPGGPSSLNSYRSRSDLPSQQARKSDMLSQQSRQSDFPYSQQSRQSDFPYQQTKQKTDLMQQAPERHRSRQLQDKLSNSFEMEFNLSSKSITDMEPASSSGNHFSIPGPIYKQGVTDSCLYYNVHDSPKYLEGLTQVRIDSDLRSLFAISKIDDFEKLRKETNESNVILKGLSTRVSERLKVFNTMPATESVEYSTLKEISYATENIRICVDSQLSLLACFWTSELPAPNERGEFVNQKLLDHNAALREELCLLMGKDGSGYKSGLNEEMICRTLESTLDVVARARHNFEIQKYRRNSPHRSPSHSPRK